MQLIQGGNVSRSPLPIHAPSRGLSLACYFRSVQVPEGVEYPMQVTGVSQDLVDEGVPLAAQLFPRAALKQNSWGSARKIPRDTLFGRDSDRQQNCSYAKNWPEGRACSELPIQARPHLLPLITCPPQTRAPRGGEWGEGVTRPCSPQPS